MKMPLSMHDIPILT